MRKDPQGTLIVSLPYSNGIVLSSDKSLNVGNNIQSTDQVKIQQLGRRAAFALTGDIRISSCHPGVPDCDPIEIVKTYLADKPPKPLRNYAPALRDMLKTALETVVQTRFRTPYPPTEEINFQVLVWSLNARKEFVCYRIIVHWNKSTTNANVEDINPFRGLLLHGHTGLLDEIMSGRYPTLEYLRNDERLKFAMERPRECERMTANEVGSITRFVVKACSEAQHVATPNNTIISDTSDTCALDRTTGFRWFTDKS